jgi:hypothetical protein
MRTWLIQGRMAALLGLGIIAGSLRAQEREQLPNPYALPENQQVSPWGGLTHNVAPPAPWPQWMPVEPPPKDHLWNGPVCRCLRSLSCWSHPDCYCCGSLKSECSFIFGSCREFFNEPCLNAPPILVPPGYDASGLLMNRKGCCGR